MEPKEILQYVDLRIAIVEVTPTQMTSLVLASCQGMRSQLCVQQNDQELMSINSRLVSLETSLHFVNFQLPFSLVGSNMNQCSPQEASRK